MILGLLVVPGPEAPDDGEITESHVEPGKYLKTSALILDEPLGRNQSFHNFSRRHRSTRKLRTAEWTLTQTGSLKNATAPPFCLSTLCIT